MLRGAGHLGGILRIALCASFSPNLLQQMKFSVSWLFLFRKCQNKWFPSSPGRIRRVRHSSKQVIEKGDRWRNMKGLMYCCSPLSDMNDIWNIYHQNHCSHMGSATQSLDNITALLPFHWAGDAAADLEEGKASHMKAGLSSSTFPQQWQGVQLVMRVY